MAHPRDGHAISGRAWEGRGLQQAFVLFRLHPERHRRGRDVHLPPAPLCQKDRGGPPGGTEEVIALMRALAFTGGDWVIYILILCSVITLAVIVERAVILSKEQKENTISSRILKVGQDQFSEGVFLVEETMA